MYKILFVCLGNICRSPMAEYLLKDIVLKKGISDDFLIESAGTSNEEYGNPVHYGTKKILNNLGISCENKRARKMTIDDYNNFDYIICMESNNIKGINRIVNDTNNKVFRLLDFSDNPRDIADPWYTGNFDETYSDIIEGINSFLKYLGY